MALINDEEFGLVALKEGVQAVAIVMIRLDAIILHVRVVADHVVELVRVEN